MEKKKKPCVVGDERARGHDTEYVIEMAVMSTDDEGCGKPWPRMRMGMRWCLKRCLFRRRARGIGPQDVHCVRVLANVSYRTCHAIVCFLYRRCDAHDAIQANAHEVS